MEQLFRSLQVASTLLVALASTTTHAQVIIDQGLTPDSLVRNVLLGAAVEVNDVRFNGADGTLLVPVGIGPSEVGRFDGSNTSIGIPGGVVLSTNVAMHHIPGPNDRLDRTGGGFPLSSAMPDMDLSRLTGNAQALASGGNNIYNKAVLEFDLVPQNDMLAVRYVFSSEEYERWVCSEYNDVFGFFLSGPGITGPFQDSAINLAYVPGSLSPVSINTVNNGLMTADNANGPSWADPFAPCFAVDSNWQANAQYYRYNGGQWPAPLPVEGDQQEAPYNVDPYYIQHNGLTVVLTASAAVLIGETYHIKMGVANVEDNSYPSAVFIQQQSVACQDRFTLTVDAGANVDLSGTDPVLYESLVDSVYLRFNRWGGSYLDEHLHIAVEGDALAGLDYAPSLPDSLHFNALDSAVVVPIAIPVRTDVPRQLVIHLITSNGDKVLSHTLNINGQLTVGAADHETKESLSIFPNPAGSTVYVALPPGPQGAVELQVVDMAGRVVLRQMTSSTVRSKLDLGHLPDGLYTLKASLQGKVISARLQVRH